MVWCLNWFGVFMWCLIVLMCGMWFVGYLLWLWMGILCVFRGVLICCCYCCLCWVCCFMKLCWMCCIFMVMMWCGLRWLWWVVCCLLVLWMVGCNLKYGLLVILGSCWCNWKGCGSGGFWVSWWCWLIDGSGWCMVWLVGDVCCFWLNFCVVCVKCLNCVDLILNLKWFDNVDGDLCGWVVGWNGVERLCG